MPEIRFNADTHPELLRQVRVWLESAEEQKTAADVVENSAELTKDALRLIAAAAPAPLADSEIVKGLAELGYRATDASRDAWLAGLDGLAQVTDGTLVKRVSEGAYEMNTRVARQLLKSVLGQ